MFFPSDFFVETFHIFKICFLSFRIFLKVYLCVDPFRLFEAICTIFFFRTTEKNKNDNTRIPLASTFDRSLCMPPSVAVTVS